RGLTRELLARDRDLCFLYELGAKIGRLTDEEEIAAVVVRETMEVLDADCGWIVFWDGETATVPDGSRLAIDERTVDEINRVVLQPCQALGKRDLIAHTLEDLGGAPGLDFPVRLLASSIVNGGTEHGYLCLGRGPNRDIFIAPDLKLIDAVASVTAVELENVRLHREELEKLRLAKELEKARQIQRWLLPRDFCCAGFLEAAGLSEPCHEIGGDYYDLFRLADGRCLLGIADVTGKGAPASLQAALIQGIVHGCSRHSMDLSTQMETLNRCVACRSVLGSYPSALLATLDESGLLSYTNGGHMPPLWIRTNGRVEELEEGGLLLGILEDAEYPLGTARLHPGDLLVLYSDGVTDAENLSRNTFGQERLHDWASQQAGRSPAEAKESLLSAILQFCGGQRQADDLTALIVRYKAANPHASDHAL
ncbi:MAG: SpoIIE family protein phosphatase, partial [bacterium]|nr:SpoIIE family protein phosphatase [bacterium]